MALRSLTGKLGRRLVRWAEVSCRDVPPPPAAAASDLGMKLEGSIEAETLAIRKRVIEEERIRQQEFKKRIRKGYRNIGIMSAACVGLLIFYWLQAEKALVELKNAKRIADAEAKKAFAEIMNAEAKEAFAEIMNAKRIADAKEEGNAVDEE